MSADASPTPLLNPPPDSRLRSMTVVVTGAGRGLGRAVARAMAQEDAHLWVCDKTVQELDTTIRLIETDRANRSDRSDRSNPSTTKPTVQTRRFDLASQDACERFALEVLEHSPRIDCLVNNAAILDRNTFDSVTVDDWQRTMAINLTAPFLLSQLFLKGMDEHGGSIINVSSRAGVLGFPKQTSYCASKFGIEGFSRALAEELKEHSPPSVSVNTITPGMRIKPTNLSDREEQNLPASEIVWKDPLRIAPAFVYLALRRGRPTGCRFDAERLSQGIRQHEHDYGLTPEQAEELSE